MPTSTFNTHKSVYRHYRTMESAQVDEQKLQIILEETDLHITLPAIAPTNEIINLCIEYVQELRLCLKAYALQYPAFQHSLIPIKPEKNAPPLIIGMCQGAKYAHVGPFAAVAGSIAQMIAQKIANLLRDLGLPQEVLVENGGDTFLISQKERIIGILSNPEQEGELGLRIQKGDCPLSLCSSSATIGHSISFGKSDIVVVRAKNASLADAMATSYGNMLKSAKDINKVLEKAQKDAHIKLPHNPFTEQSDTLPTKPTSQLSGIDGVFLQCEGKIGIWGAMELVAIESD